MSSSSASREQIKVECTLCNTPHYFPLSQAGATVRCEMCTSPMTVPLQPRSRAKPLPMPDPYGLSGEEQEWQGEKKAGPSYPKPEPYAVREDEANATSPASAPEPLRPESPRSFFDVDDSPLDSGATAHETAEARPSRPAAAARIKAPASLDDPFFDDHGSIGNDDVTVACPGCSKKLTLEAGDLGQRIACPRCGREIVVGRDEKLPSPEKPAPPAAPASARRQAAEPARQAAAPTWRDLGPVEASPSAGDDSASRPKSRLAALAGKWQDKLIEREERLEAQRRKAEFESAMKAPEVALIAPANRTQHQRSKSDSLHAAIDNPLPPAPKHTFVSGIFDFPLQKNVAVRIAVFGLFLLITGETIVTAFAMAAPWGQAGDLVLVAFLVPSILLTIIALSFGASQFFIVLDQTAQGVDTIDDWGDFAFWELIYSMLRFGLQAGAALAAGYAVEVLVLPARTSVPPGLIAAAVSAAAMPIVVLSSYQENAVLWPFSPTVLSSLVSRWWCWLIVYVQTGVLMVGWLALFWLSVRKSPALTVLWSSFALAFVVFLLARIWGRLMWRIVFDAKTWNQRRELRSKIIQGDRPAERWNEKQKAMIDAG